jgi:hypothetical protein
MTGTSEGPRDHAQRVIAHDVTACIPTLARPTHLYTTVTTILSAETVPGTILISEGTNLPSERSAVERVLDEITPPSSVTISLLPAPPNGQRCGNRNWLAHHARTRFVLFVDDDVDVPPTFVSEALTKLESPEIGIVVAASEEVGGSGWLTHRCHFRPALDGDPIAVGFAVVLWRADLFRSLWLDENIVYGSEEADISIRLYAKHPRTICHQATVNFHDRGRVPDGDVISVNRRDDIERSRCYVAVRRYHESRLALVAFLLHELAANAIKRRRLLPRGLVRGQWRQVLLHLLGGRLPAWVRRPRVSVYG